MCTKVQLHQFYISLQKQTRDSCPKMRSKRQNQHMLASYCHQIRNLPLLVMWKAPSTYHPTWRLGLQFQLDHSESWKQEHTTCISLQYTSEMYLLHSQSPTDGEHWPKPAYFQIPTNAGISDEWLKELWQFRVFGLIILGCSRQNLPVNAIGYPCS